MSGKVILVAGITRVIRKPALGNSVEYSSGRHRLEERTTGENRGQQCPVSTTDIDHQLAIAEIVHDYAVSIFRRHLGGVSHESAFASRDGHSCGVAERRSDGEISLWNR